MSCPPGRPRFYGLVSLVLKIAKKVDAFSRAKIIHVSVLEEVGGGGGSCLFHIPRCLWYSCGGSEGGGAKGPPSVYVCMFLPCTQLHALLVQLTQEGEESHDIFFASLAGTRTTGRSQSM